jgi:hypothetical protein
MSHSGLENIDACHGSRRPRLKIAAINRVSITDARHGSIELGSRSNLRPLKANIEEIERDQPNFFGTLTIEVNYREGNVETVIVDRRQTFKN